MRNYNQSNIESVFAMLFFGIVWGLMLAIPIGWVMNILDIIAIDFNAPLTAESILHLIGVFIVPLGAVMGIFF